MTPPAWWLIVGDVGAATRRHLALRLGLRALSALPAGSGSRTAHLSACSGHLASLWPELMLILFNHGRPLETPSTATAVAVMFAPGDVGDNSSVFIGTTCPCSACLPRASFVPRYPRGNRYRQQAAGCCCGSFKYALRSGVRLGFGGPVGPFRSRHHLPFISDSVGVDGVCVGMRDC